jgi:hypothetical protein
MIDLPMKVVKTWQIWPMKYCQNYHSCYVHNLLAVVRVAIVVAEAELARHENLSVGRRVG